MILVPFFQIPHGDRLAKNIKSLCVQEIPRSTHRSFNLVFLSLRSVAQASWDLFCHFFGLSLCLDVPFFVFAFHWHFVIVVSVQESFKDLKV